MNISSAHTAAGSLEFSKKGRISCPFFEIAYILGLADAEHLGVADRANTLNRGFAILQGDLLRILDFNLLPALHTIRCSHVLPSLSVVFYLLL